MVLLKVRKDHFPIWVVDMGALDSIRQKIQQEAMAAITEAESKGKIATENNVHSFYSSAGTGRYKRTGQLGDSTRSTGVSGGGNHYTARIYLDVAGVSYKVPNPAFSPPYASYFSAQDVFNAAEAGGAHIAGKPGFWAKSEHDIEQALIEACSRHFS